MSIQYCILDIYYSARTLFNPKIQIKTKTHGVFLSISNNKLQNLRIKPFCPSAKDTKVFSWIVRNE